MFLGQLKVEKFLNRFVIYSIIEGEGFGVNMDGMVSGYKF